MHEDLLIVNADIDDDVIQAVLNLMPAKSAKKLIMVVNTYGGNPAIAYRTMQHLDALYDQILAVVPDKAMSAGTLMCLGADVIYMNTGSALGPLDLQVPHPTDGGQISTLDIREATFDIFGLADSVTRKLFEQNYYKLKIGKNYAAKLAHEAAVTLLAPMIDKIDPYHLHASYRNADIGQKYARILLANRMMQGRPDEGARASKILAEEYEMHSYAITKDEAVTYLHLNVEDISSLNLPEGVQLDVSSIPTGVVFLPATSIPVNDDQAELPLDTLGQSDERSVVDGKD